jgi:hypothetical protein
MRQEMCVASNDSTDRADGSASQAAQEADAVENVERNTKSQTTASSYTTTDPEVIRAWAEARGGTPASATGDTEGNDAGLLRIEFRDDSGKLEDVDWEPFFKTFEDRKLAFVYQEKTSNGEVSRFNRFVSRENR